MDVALRNLSAAGVAVWLDDLSRNRLTSGSLTQLIDDGEIVGITTNPTIFAKAIGQGAGYEDHLRDLALRGTAVGEAVRLLTGWDVRAACDALRPIFDRTAGRDGRVSIEVDPRISADAARTLAEAHGLWWLVDRPNVLIKIPATKEGLPAITDALADGISVNVTLIFTVDQYRAVLEAFLTGLERRLAAGHSIGDVESVASFFISRVDVEVDRRLDGLAPKADPSSTQVSKLKGKTAIANAALAYAHYEEVVSSPRWRRLADAGGRLQRLLWASTGVKDPAYHDTLYVDELVAPDTVNTMPEATLRAFADHGNPAAGRLQTSADVARAVIDGLANVGVDMIEVGDLLQRQGLAAFAESWDELIASVSKQLEQKGAGVMEHGAVTPAGADGAPAAGPAAGAPAPEHEGVIA